MSFDYMKIDDFNLHNQTVFVRLDINSPLDPPTGRILEDTRIRESVETLEALHEARVIIGAHQSRPGLEDFTPLEEHVRVLQKYLPQRIDYVEDIFGSTACEQIRRLQPGGILMLENLRFYSEENMEAEPEIWAKCILVRRLSPLLTLYVNDAFPTCHRNQPSLVGFPEVLPAAAGRTLEKELKALQKIVNSVEHPSTYLLGGVKAKERLEVLDRVLKDGKVDHVLTTGLLAEIFLNVKGVDLGPSNKGKMKGHEKDLERAKDLMQEYSDKIHLPQDIAVDDNGRRSEQSLKSVPKGKIMDIGEKTIEEYTSILHSSKTIVANGPAGVFEREEFSHGTRKLLNAMAHSKAYTVIGGGHLGSLADTYNLREDFDHISTGGGAMLQFLAEGNLPGIQALERAAKRYRSNR